MWDSQEESVKLKIKLETQENNNKRWKSDSSENVWLYSLNLQIN